MTDRYYTVYREGKGEYTEKKSRFLASVLPVETEAEAEEILRLRRRQYYDARHHCSACRFGEHPEIVRSSDDGEPSGSAGRPILTVLEGAGLHNTIAVVTRYFGGTLLGVGGLVHAYQSAVKAAIADAVLLERLSGTEYTIRCSYSDDGRLKSDFAANGVIVLDTQYADQVTSKILVRADEAERMEKQIRELTAARCAILSVRDLTYGLADGEVIPFPDPDTPLQTSQPSRNR